MQTMNITNKAPSSNMKFDRGSDRLGIYLFNRKIEFIIEIIRSRTIVIRRD